MQNKVLKRILSGLATGVWLGSLTALGPGLLQADAEPGLVGYTIVIDAGHGGPDGGASGVGGIKEKDITLPITLYLADNLRQAGALVYVTRTVDKDFATDQDRALKRRHSGDLRGRYELIRSKNPDAVVSIHCNADPSPLWGGAQTIYMSDHEEGKRLAVCIQTAFKQMLLPTKRAADDMDTLYLLRRLPCPSVIAEVGFISNPVEAAHLATSKYQQQVALAVYSGVMAYFGAKDEPPGETPPAES